MSTALVIGLGAPPASAATVEPIAEGFAGPLQIAVGSGGNVFVGEAFSGLLTQVSSKGNSVLAAEPGGEVAGVAVEGKALSYLTTGPGGALLKHRAVDGTISTVADLGAYEADNNPDAGQSYGYQGDDADCNEELPPFLQTYTGIVESHPYGLAANAGGTRYVADAAGNSILKVTAGGDVSTVAVLPAQPHVFTAEQVEANELPECLVGETVNFESVPTDVEIGPKGQLYVSTLPGGPEDPSLGARGGVYRVNPSTGVATRIASGLFAATNVAVAPDGTVYVAELFAGRISKIVGGAPETVVDVPLPASVEWTSSGLYASIDVFGAGAIVKITDDPVS
jgi:hypothetical protein